MNFWSCVLVGDANSCWEWNAGKFSDGYGRATHDGRRQAAHRIAWELTYGPIPSGLFVLHRCDNKPCVNPAHLFLGTQADNVTDMLAKGRGPTGDRSGARTHPERLARGERHGNAKLTDAAVREIRLWRASGLTQREIAVEYGVDQSTVCDVINRRIWGHVS